MPELINFIISDESERDNQNQLKVINPKNSLVLPFLPSAYSFSITFGIVNLLNEQGQFEFTLIDPTNKTVAGVNNINYQNNRNTNLTNEAQGFIMNLNLRNVVFKKEGFHTVIFKIDGEEVGTRKFYVAVNKNQDSGGTSE